MKVRYVITTLKKGVDPAAYEKWVREYDYKVAKSLPSIVSYTTHRIEGPSTGPRMRAGSTSSGSRFATPSSIRRTSPHRRDRS